MPNTPDAHRRGDEGKQQDRGEHDVGCCRVAMLPHKIPAIAQVENTSDRDRQDDGIKGLGDDHDKYGARLEDRDHQTQQ